MQHQVLRNRISLMASLFFSRMMKPSGHLTFANGNRNVGAFDNDKMHCQGTYTLVDGIVRHSGLWKQQTRANIIQM